MNSYIIWCILTIFHFSKKSYLYLWYLGSILLEGQQLECVITQKDHIKHKFWAMHFNWSTYLNCFKNHKTTNAIFSELLLNIAISLSYIGHLHIKLGFYQHKSCTMMIGLLDLCMHNQKQKVETHMEFHSSIITMVSYITIF